MAQIIPGDTHRVKPEAPYYVQALALGIPAIFLGIQIAGWLAHVSAITHGLTDFRQLYTAGYTIRSGHASGLYDYQIQKTFQDALVSPEQSALPFNHMAFEALLYVPFSLLRYRIAYFTFLAFNLALLAASYRMLRSRMDNLAQVFSWLPAAFFVCFLPIVAALIQGQDSILLMTLLIAATVCLDRDREVTAGVLVGLTLFKFQIALPIALLFFVWRKWRFSAGFVLSALAVGCVSLRLVGFAQAREYAHSLAAMSLLSSQAGQFKWAIYPDHMANLRGLIFGLAGTRLTAFWIRAVTAILSAAALLWVAARASAKNGMDAILVAITASALVSYHFLVHDMSVLLIPVAVVMNRYIEAEATGDAGGRLANRAAALMFVAPICIAYVPGHFYLVSLPLCAFLAVLIERIRGDATVSNLRDQLVS